MNELLEMLRDLLPGVSDVRLKNVVAVCARETGRRGGRPITREVCVGLQTGSETHVAPQSPSDLSLDLGPDFSQQSGSEDRGSNEPPLLTFPVVGKGNFWHFRKGNLANLAEAFPGLDVMGEARKALAWVQASARNRKTADGMARFLFHWLSRSQNAGAAKMPARDPNALPRLA
jgi:hypothetical protein